ncbi:MAG: hypothetical protein QXT51_01920 [Nitrososphaerota archaeon]
MNMVVRNLEEKSIFLPNNSLSLIAVDLLKVLKSSYNYRKLSNITGIPVSTLTRYLTGKTMPRGVKARKLIKNLIMNLNISSLLSHFTDGDGSLDLYEVMFNPNMIKIIAAHVLNEFAGMRITSLLALDNLSIPLTTYLSAITMRPFSIVSREPLPIKNSDMYTLILEDSKGVWPLCYWLYFKNVKKRESILIISSKTPEARLFNKLAQIIEKKNSEIVGFFSVVGSLEEFSRLNLKSNCRKYYIISED